jgi:hypothetical protein
MTIRVGEFVVKLAPGLEVQLAESSIADLSPARISDARERKVSILLDNSHRLVA